MTLEKTDFNGLYVLHPKVFEDKRGFFMESYNMTRLQELTGYNVAFVQDNQSHSVKGVLRGLHYQRAPYAQTKMVRVLKGSILDIVLDIRKDEPTFGRVYSHLLSEENRKQLFIPKGFAHGFAVVSDFAEVLYKCDEYYQPGSESGINILDPQLAIARLLPEVELVLSDKDRILPAFRDVSTKL